MTSFIAGCGSGRSTSFIPAVPAAWSVTTIAFIGIVSSVICLSGGKVPQCREGGSERAGDGTESRGSNPRANSHERSRARESGSRAVSLPRGRVQPPLTPCWRGCSIVVSLSLWEVQMAGTTKAGVRRGTAADQQIDPLTQKVLVVATELLSGGRNPFAAVEGPSGLFDHGPYLEALEKYRDAGRESKLWEWSPSVH